MPTEVSGERVCRGHRSGLPHDRWHRAPTGAGWAARRRHGARYASPGRGQEAEEEGQEVPKAQSLPPARLLLVQRGRWRARVVRHDRARGDECRNHPTLPLLLPVRRRRCVHPSSRSRHRPTLRFRGLLSARALPAAVMPVRRCGTGQVPAPQPPVPLFRRPPPPGYRMIPFRRRSQPG
jgi:hypothetical protein